MIINDSNLIGITIGPFKKYAPLIIDPNREKTLQVTLQAN